VTCEQRRDLLLLYVSNASEADEKQELRRHLASGCPECVGYLAEAEATFNAIPLALDPVLPPSGLKKRLMDRIDAAERANSVPQVRSELSPDSFPIRLFRMFVPAAVAAGIAIVATHAFMNQQVQKLTMRVRDTQNESTANQIFVVQQARELDALRQQFQSQAQVVEMLRSPDVKVTHLQPGKDQPAIIANLVSDPTSHRWEFLSTSMKSAPAGQTYEMWIIPKGGAPLPAGTFDLDPGGRAAVVVDLPKDIGPGTTAAVTNEKAGGVPAPAGQIQVSGTVE
jgi:anti-sigma-K factor RskA